MKYLIKDFYNKSDELCEIEKKIKNSWVKLLHLQNIHLKKCGVQINHYNINTQPDIIFHLTTVKELTSEQIRKLEKNTCSQLYLDDATAAESDKTYYNYEFLVHTESLPVEDNVLNSWLKD